MKGFLTIIALLLSSKIIAAEGTYQDWYWTDNQASAGYLYAATSNDDGHVLGEYCYIESGQCLYALLMDTACEDGSDEYVGLINSDLGAYNVNFSCFGGSETGHYIYVFRSFDDIEKVVLESTKVGIAFPLESDRFVVIRFSLMGSNQAIDAMEKKFLELPSASDATGTRSQYL